MAAVSCVLSEDQFLCSICLEVFTDPVTTPCGHSFCKSCINKHWDTSPQYYCPVCKESFSSRPQLKLNTFMSEMVCQFKNKPQDEDLDQSSEAEVLCDVCSEPKLKALKSCLVCLLSYCQRHLEPHFTVPRLKKHQLISPVDNLEDRICSQHNKPLELFCRDDQHFICYQCSYADHKGHNTVPLEEERKVKQAEMKKINIKINERRLKVEDIQRLVELSQNNAERAVEEVVNVFNDLMKCIEQSLEQFKQNIKEKQKKTEEESEGLIEKMETEILSLEQRRAEMEQLWSSEDHLHFLQTFTSVTAAPSVDDWTEVTVRIPSYEGTVAQALSELNNTLFHPNIKKVLESELKRVQKYAVDVTLDPDTAHQQLALSKDLKQVHYSDQRNNVPDTPERFVTKIYVLGKQKFSSGKFYFEVQVKGKTAWHLGVAKESLDRKVKNTPTTEKGCWFIYRRINNEYVASMTPRIIFSPKSSPEKVGVFVDYEEGLVSFYDVDSAELIYSFTNCQFTDKLLPSFCPGNNDSTPMILTRVTI